MSLPSDDTRREEPKTEKGQGSNAETGRRSTGLAAAAGIEPAQKRKETTREGGEKPAEGKSGEKESGTVASSGKSKNAAKQKKVEKKDPSEMTAAERRELKERNKKRKVVGGAVAGGVIVAAGAVFVLTADLSEVFDNFGGGGAALEDDQSNISGSGGGGAALEDDRGESDSLTPAQEGFPFEMEEYLKTGYNSVENSSMRNSWEDEYLDPDGWQPLETDDGVVEFEDWDIEANAPIDPRRDLSPGDEGYEEAMGWIFRDNAEQQYREGYIGDISQNWPAREMGYTNNPDREMFDDGMPNPWYSYILAEDVQWFFGDSLQRLMNPVYGGWFYDHESPQTMDTSVLRELFTESWWNENIEEGDPSNLPIFADWDDNSYGGEEVGTYGWFGEVVGSDISIEQTDEGYSIINATLDLEYTALSSDDNTITREAQLDIQVIPNREDTNDINNRFLISNAQLTVGE